MRKHASVFMLMARSTIYNVLGLLIVMAAAQAGLFWFMLKRGPVEDEFGLEMIIHNSRIAWVFGICFLLLTTLLCSTGLERSSKQGYTLMRLSVSERWVFVWQSVYNTLCYLLLWCVQILIVMALCALYTAKAAPEYVTGQTVFLAFYRSSFLRFLLPFEEALWWIGNALVVLACGCLSARVPMAQRSGTRPYEALLLVCAQAALLSREMGDGSSVWLVCICAALTLGCTLYLALGKEERP